MGVQAGADSDDFKTIEKEPAECVDDMTAEENRHGWSTTYLGYSRH